jgi:hypothetical protein
MVERVKRLTDLARLGTSDSTRSDRSAVSRPIKLISQLSHYAETRCSLLDCVLLLLEHW